MSGTKSPWTSPRTASEGSANWISNWLRRLTRPSRASCLPQFRVEARNLSATGIMPIPMNSPRRSRSWLGVVLRLCGTATVFALLFHFLPLGELGASLHRVPIYLWFFVLGAYLLVHVVGVVKWRLMLNAAGAGLSFAQSVRCYGGGLFGTLFLPSIVGGDVVRVGLALRLPWAASLIASWIWLRSGVWL